MLAELTVILENSLDLGYEEDLIFEYLKKENKEVNLFGFVKLFNKDYGLEETSRVFELYSKNQLLLSHLYKTPRVCTQDIVAYLKGGIVNYNMNLIEKVKEVREKEK